MKVFIAMLIATSSAIASVPSVSAWKHCTRTPVSDVPERHTIHSYFNVCPESPDGRYVVFYASKTPSSETGEIILRNRETGKEETIATNIETEDAHRAACQQWMQGGKTVVYHNHSKGVWTVYAYDVETKQTRTLATERQLGFTSPDGKGNLVPLYGYHWNPTKHRDFEVYDLNENKIRTVVTINDAIDAIKSLNPEWLETTFTGNKDKMSIFFL